MNILNTIHNIINLFKGFRVRDYHNTQIKIEQMRVKESKLPEPHRDIGQTTDQSLFVLIKGDHIPENFDTDDSDCCDAGWYITWPEITKVFNLERNEVIVSGWTCSRSYTTGCGTEDNADLIFEHIYSVKDQGPITEDSIRAEFEKQFGYKYQLKTQPALLFY